MAQKTVTEIPADPLLGDLRKRKRKLRVAAYCRVSTEEEEQQNMRAGSWPEFLRTMGSQASAPRKESNLTK